MTATNATVRKILQTAALEFQKKHGLVQVYNEGFTNEIVEQTVRECCQLLTNIGHDYTREQLEKHFGIKKNGNEPTNPRNIS